MKTRQTRTFPGQFSSLAAISEFVTHGVRAAGLDERAAYAVQMAVDEACSNIIEHGYHGKETGEIICTWEVTAHSLLITLYDHGPHFDPTCVSEPDLKAELRDRTRGGLGIYFIRKLMDHVEYSFSPDGGNVLTLVKHKRKSP